MKKKKFNLWKVYQRILTFLRELYAPVTKSEAPKKTKHYYPEPQSCTKNYNAGKNGNYTIHRTSRK